jgi:hypothetical protein
VDRPNDMLFSFRVLSESYSLIAPSITPRMK